MWWDNGVFPGQPAVDYMFGPLPANLSEVRPEQSFEAVAGVTGQAGRANVAGGDAG